MTTDAQLIDGLRQLIAEWEASHADWCCTRGCSQPEGRHIDAGALQQWIADIGTQPDDGPTCTPISALPHYDCPSTCTCEVGLYLRGLCALLEEATGA